jgi:hypothetical protein
MSLNLKEEASSPTEIWFVISRLYGAIRHELWVFGARRPDQTNCVSLKSTTTFTTTA